MLRINRKITLLLIIFILSLLGTVILTFVDTGTISNVIEVNASTAHADHAGWIDLNSYGSDVLKSGNYYLTADLQANLAMEEYSNVTLCLNGHKLTGDGNTAVITVSNEASLTIDDCNNSTPHQYYIDSTGLWKFDDGTQQWKDAHNNAGEDQQGTVNGGVITNGNGEYGGGVNVVDDGKLIIQGGTISGNTANNGSAVSVVHGNFTMNGGTISGNTANNGGIVFNAYGEFTMNGGTIADNTYSENYAGIFLFVNTYNAITNGYIKDKISFQGFTLKISGGYFAESKVDDKEIQYFLPEGAELVELEQDSAEYEMGYRYKVNCLVTIRIDTSGTSQYDGSVLANNQDFKITVNKNGEEITEYDSSFQYAIYETQDFVEGLPANVGKYTIKVTLKVSGEVYEQQFDYEITKASLTISDLQAVDRPYNGTTKIQLVGNLVGVINGDDVKLYGTGVIGSADIGTYKVDGYEFMLSGASADNYVVSTTTYDLYAEITAKVLQVKWSNTILIYNGTAQKPTATVDTGIEGEKLNLVVDGSGTELGTYTATARMQTVDNNYELTNATIEFFINIASLTSANGKVIVTTETGFSKGWILEATESVDLTSISLPDGQSLVTAYDINLKNGEQIAQPFGKVQVTIKLTEQQQKASKLSIYNIADDGTLHLIESVVNGDSIIFETEHLSVYAITTSAQISNLYIVIIIILSVLFILELCVYGVFLHKTIKMINKLQ